MTNKRELQKKSYEDEMARRLNKEADKHRAIIEGYVPIELIPKVEIVPPIEPDKVDTPMMHFADEPPVVVATCNGCGCLIYRGREPDHADYCTAVDPRGRRKLSEQEFKNEIMGTWSSEGETEQLQNNLDNAINDWNKRQSASEDLLSTESRAESRAGGRADPNIHHHSMTIPTDADKRLDEILELIRQDINERALFFARKDQGKLTPRDIELAAFHLCFRNDMGFKWRHLERTALND